MERFKPAWNGCFRHVKNRSKANQLVRSQNHAIVLAGYYKSGYTQAEVDQAAKLSTRIRRYMHYCEEIAPQWENFGEPIHWADNSVTQEQVSLKCSRRRSVQLKPPSGDRCF